MEEEEKGGKGRVEGEIRGNKRSNKLVKSPIEKGRENERNEGTYGGVEGRIKKINERQR